MDPLLVNLCRQVIYKYEQDWTGLPTLKVEGEVIFIDAALENYFLRKWFKTKNPKHAVMNAFYLIKEFQGK